MSNTHNHKWVYVGPVCCGYRFECVLSGCSRGTKVKNLGPGEWERGDPAYIDDQTDEARHISRVKKIL